MLELRIQPVLYYYIIADDIHYRRVIMPSRATLYTTWLLWGAMVLAAVYSFLLTALTVTRMQLPFDSMESFLESNYTLMGGSVSFKQLNVNEG